MIESIHEHAPDARITLLGPSPFDDVTRPPRFEGGYNGVMQHYAELDRTLAQKYGGTFIDLNAPVVSVLEKAQQLDPMVAKLLLPDRVHPDPLAHWVMAEALLKGWHAPALVASVTIDGRAATVTEAQNTAIDQLRAENGTLHWTETDRGLPMPILQDNATSALLLQLTDIQEQLNQEPLRVTGLEAASYKLQVDDSVIGTFSAADLAKGVNLADFQTPMRAQAQRVSWLVRDRDEAQYIRLRMAIRKADSGIEPMQAFLNSLEDSIYETATPHPHQFSLSPVSAQP